jgi:hypothetical protein
MAQIDRHSLVPILLRHVPKGVPIIAGGVIHQDPHRPHFPFDLG